jgi:hypothetical protein
MREVRQATDWDKIFTIYISDQKYSQLEYVKNSLLKCNTKKIAQVYNGQKVWTKNIHILFVCWGTRDQTQGLVLARHRKDVLTHGWRETQTTQPHWKQFGSFFTSYHTLTNHVTITSPRRKVYVPAKVCTQMLTWLCKQPQTGNNSDVYQQGSWQSNPDVATQWDSMQQYRRNGLPVHLTTCRHLKPVTQECTQHTPMFRKPLTN